MKHTLLFSACLMGLLHHGWSQADSSLAVTPDTATAEAPDEIRYVLLRPSDRTSETIKRGERNPFAKDSLDLARDTKNDNEENAIRERLTKLSVVGITRTQEGELRIMLGDMLLEKSKPVPQILPNQSLQLIVNEIREDGIEMQWVERKNTGLPPRLLTIPVDLRPYVRFALHGQLKDKKAGKEKNPNSIGRMFLNNKEQDNPKVGEAQVPETPKP